MSLTWQIQSHLCPGSALTAHRHKMCLFSHRPSVTLDQNRSLNLTICLSSYKTRSEGEVRRGILYCNWYLVRYKFATQVLYRASAHFLSEACLMFDDNLVWDSDNESPNLRLIPAWSSSHGALRLSQIICSPAFYWADLVRPQCMCRMCLADSINAHPDERGEMCLFLFLSHNI